MFSSVIVGSTPGLIKFVGGHGLAESVALSEILMDCVSNPLVLWDAVSGDDFKLAYFNDGDSIRAVEAKARDETIS